MPDGAKSAVVYHNLRDALADLTLVVPSRLRTRRGEYRQPIAHVHAVDFPQEILRQEVLDLVVVLEFHGRAGRKDPKCLLKLGHG